MYQSLKGINIIGATIEKNGAWPKDLSYDTKEWKDDSNKWSIHQTELFMKNCTNELHIIPIWELTIPEKKLSMRSSVY